MTGHRGAVKNTLQNPAHSETGVAVTTSSLPLTLYRSLLSGERRIWAITPIRANRSCMSLTPGFLSGLAQVSKQCLERETEDRVHVFHSTPTAARGNACGRPL